MQLADDSTPKPFDRQPGESRQAFAAFVVFRDLGAARSGPRVAQECAKSASLIKRWSARWNWLARAAAWDAELDRLWLAELAQARIDVPRRLLAISRAMQSKAIEALAAIRPGDLAPAQIQQWLTAAARVQLDVLG